MRDEDLKTLRSYCEDFKKYRQNTEDGEGNNLHDIKHTFDYVRGSMDKYNLTGTAFGTEVSKKAEDCANVLSQLWNCLQNLEVSIEGFCIEQEKNNRGN